MFSAVLLGLLSLDGIHVGDCLSPQEIQKETGVYWGSLYVAGDCNVDYLPSGELKDHVACAESSTYEVHSGEWSREIQKHLEPGLFWPSPVPCMSSVVSSKLERSEFSSLHDQPACVPEDFYVSRFHREEMKTARFDVMQGEIFVPSPLVVRDETYGLDADVGPVLTFCQEKEMSLEYLGWGVLQATYKKRSCLAGGSESCESLRFTVSENDQKKMCFLVKKIRSCSVQK